MFAPLKIYPQVSALQAIVVMAPSGLEGKLMINKLLFSTLSKYDLEILH